MERKKIWLASGSPRRRELLERMGVSFAVEAANVDETAEGGPRETVLAVSRRKAEAVAARHPGETVLAADTVVFCGGILGKPRSEAEARDMLKRLSGNWHEVYTGVCVVRDGQTDVRVEVTRVHFVSLSQADIEAYVATGEPMDKAGAYGIQGRAGVFIDRIEGCPHNVMGLPLALTREMLG
ncbi:MAG: Maf family protein [Christensenellales bacterium]|uniref:dTTP/UTP pyrophosphatase n=1 Tax=Candidatus Avichristensenella intestinipullorum TaxID=2840693 RepID=A0A9D0YVW7_9FIRM|nr:Maf family protein [Christensenellales bacterium]HIQ62830.1 septum formation inhibitor Maf [Candidatus Avichristensenella intestinipullorum]